MNAPLRHDTKFGRGAALQVFAFFHLNLAFSSIEEERRGEVIARCYWPLLKLAEQLRPDRHRGVRLYAGGDRRARSGLDRRAPAA